jgi:hypothetical protein
VALPIAPPSDRWREATSDLHSPERTVLLTDAAGNVSLLSASNAMLHVARLAGG